MIDDKIKHITIQYLHQTFNQINFGEFDFISRIEFQFKNSNYIVRTTDQICAFEKSYDEQLNDTEIESLIKHEINRHKEFIEQKIEEVRKNKKQE